MTQPSPNRPRWVQAFATTILLTALSLAGCTTPTDEESGDDANPASTLTFRNHPILGRILADMDGMTLYTFTNDDPGTSNCYDGCATNWPPVFADDTPQAPQSIAQGLSMVERTDGSMQVAYRERPLYYFIADENAGDAAGDGRNGVWFIVREPLMNNEGYNGEGDHETENSAPNYFDEVTGYYARPTDMQPTVGVVMIHEWWGLNTEIRAMAARLATHGYAVLAVDLFNGSVATTSGDAQAQVAALDQSHANANMQAAADFLRTEGVQRVASLGWCFGGGQSLQLAISGEELSATVIYYGFLVTDDEPLDAIEWPVLGIFGEDDQAISVDTVRAFETALDNVSVENHIYIYPDVGHAFANPSGDSWAPEETHDAWQRTLRFLEDNA